MCRSMSAGAIPRLPPPTQAGTRFVAWSQVISQREGRSAPRMRNGSAVMRFSSFPDERSFRRDEGQAPVALAAVLRHRAAKTAVSANMKGTWDEPAALREDRGHARPLLLGLRHDPRALRGGGRCLPAEHEPRQPC